MATLTRETDEVAAVLSRLNLPAGETIESLSADEASALELSSVDREAGVSLLKLAKERPLTPSETRRLDALQIVANMIGAARLRSSGRS